MLSERSQTQTIYTTWFHVYKVQEQTQLICSNFGQNGCHLWARWKVLTGQGNERTLWVAENILYLALNVRSGLCSIQTIPAGWNSMTSWHNEDSLKSFLAEMLRLASWPCLSHHRRIRNMDYFAKVQVTKYRTLAWKQRNWIYISILLLVLWIRHISWFWISFL